MLVFFERVELPGNHRCLCRWWGMAVSLGLSPQHTSACCLGSSTVALLLPQIWPWLFDLASCWVWEMCCCFVKQVSTKTTTLTHTKDSRIALIQTSCHYSPEPNQDQWCRNSCLSIPSLTIPWSYPIPQILFFSASCFVLLSWSWATRNQFSCCSA